MPLHGPTVPSRHRRRARAAAGALAGLAAVAAPPAAAAQATPDGTPPAPAAECYGFAFGPWTPRLDLAAAGHGALPATGAGPTAPGGRDWAAPSASESGTTLLLFPAWWPAGVRVQLATGAPAGSDTVRGVATALVADGRMRPPTSAVRVWTVRCGAGAASSADRTRPKTGPRSGARRPSREPR